MSNITNEKFVMTGHSCKCLDETTYDENGKENHVLRIQENKNNRFKFAYMPKEGLVKVDNETGSIISKNILGEFMAIKNGERKKLIRFITEYGFLIPLSGSVLEKFRFDDIFAIQKRVKDTLHLMSLIQEPRVQYKKILSIISWLIFSDKISIKSVEQENEKLETCVHSYLYEIATPRRLDYSYNDNPYDNPYITVDDSIYNSPQTVLMEQFENDSLEYDMRVEHGNMDMILHRYNAESLYLFHQDCGENTRKVIDYYYHITKDVGDLSYFDRNGDAHFSCPEEEVVQRLNSRMRKATLEIAKIVIKEELDYAISAIHPSYDLKTMSASWEIPDMYSALFFSIFYMKPEFEIYRKCENPNCECYFLISTTNSRKKYCSEECSNAMQQRNYRMRKKKASAGADAS